MMFSQSKPQPRQEPWNKGKLIGQKLPLTMQEIWSIRMRLQTVGNVRDLALFNLAIDSKLRACDLLCLRVSDVASGGEVQSRAIIRPRKTKRPVRFEITVRTRKSVQQLIEVANLSDGAYLGVVYRLGFSGLWHPYAAAHKSDVDLPADEKPPSGAAPSRTPSDCD